MRMPSANRECATCHIMWLTEFKREDVSTLIAFEPMPVTKSGKEDVASTDAMCFSCHDGFVLESRYLWEQGKHAHPVGQKPSDKIHIPRVEGKNVFPLNADGKVYCGTCHTAHGVDWGQNDAAVFMRVRNEDGQLCMACHDNKTQGPNHGMHPVNKKIQKLLDKPPEKLMAAGGLFGTNGDVVCQSCHKAHAAPAEKILLVDNTESQLCGECHIHRYSKDLATAGRLGTHPVNVKPRQLKIPDTLLEQGAKLGEDGEVICETCHRPHRALPDTALLLVENKQDSLCQDCHQDKLQVKDSKHDMALVAADTRNIRKQLAASSGPCSACHVPHKGTGPKMWARPVKQATDGADQNTDALDEQSVAAKVDPMALLCLSCHSKKGMASKHTVGEYSHPVGVDIARLGHPVKMPSYTREGVKTSELSQGAVTCASCHNPHQWDPSNAEFKGEPGEEGNNRNRFLRIANGAEAALCKTCHEKKWQVAGSKHDLRYMAPDAENTLGQTVEQSGICGSCHLVHNANAPGLWARSDLAGQGLGYVACLGCHNIDGLARNKTLGKHSHPLNVDIAKLGIEASPQGWFYPKPVKNNQVKHDQAKSDPAKKEQAGLKQSTVQDGQDKLHKGIQGGQRLHLYNKQGHPVSQGGHVGCGSCHDPHNWSTLEYAKTDHPKDLQGDSNSSFLKMADQGQSRLCVNCHFDKKSIYYTRHDLTETLPGKAFTPGSQDKMATAKPVPMAGVCSYCHQMHNANGAVLWAREKGPGSTAVAPLCHDCHQQGGLAEAKLTGKHSHPLGVSPAETQGVSSIPLFDDQGRRVPRGGKMDCSSCHDPHRWDPQSLENRNLDLVAKDGDASNSFLRMPSHGNSQLCVSCHRNKKTIIGTDHDMATTAPGAVNVQGQDKNRSGLCGQCHTPHKAEDSLYLWARQLGQGNDLIERRCRSCHDETQFAAAKIPIKSKHPGQIKIWSPAIRQQVFQRPVSNILAFDQQGRRASFGSITCASCHDPHQWAAGQPVSGPGHNQEGDVKTSYLRTDNAVAIVCADCHGQDALYRYKYFHSVTAHQKHHLFR